MFTFPFIAENVKLSPDAPAESRVGYFFATGVLPVLAQPAGAAVRNHRCWVRERVAANFARTHYFAERTHQQNKKNLWEMPMHVATRCKRSVNSNFVASGRVTTGGWGVGMCIVIIAKVSRMVCDAMMLPGLVRSHSMGRTVFVCKVDCAGGDLILCLFQRQQQLWQYPDYGRWKNYCPSRWH